LAQAEHVSPQSDPGANMNVDLVRLVALSAARPPGLLLHRHFQSVAC
jgi:hypothetical protein